MSEFLNSIDPYVRTFASLGTVITVITLLIANRKKIKTWQKNRRERTEKLDSLIDNAVQLQETAHALETLTEAMTTMTATVQQLADTVDEIAEQNKRQDAEIARSLEQRSAHDSCLFALVDVAKQNGHNGAVTEAHKEMMAYLKKEAHTPVYSG